MTKRTLDLLAAVAGLVCLLPLFVIVAILIKLDSKGPVFFTQERIGRRFRPFRIYKFRTMRADASSTGRPITCRDDPRITRIGRILRQIKIDELPQLLNVVKGDMSIVGPRPELRKYVESFRTEYERILAVRPGLTDPASLRFRNEADILATSSDPEAMYVAQVLPEKLDLATQYVDRASLATDIAVIVRTLLAVSRLKVP